MISKDTLFPTGYREEDSINSKRTSYIDWDEYFMAVAFLSAKRSKDPVTQVGACIVNNDKKIVGIGYNGMPKGCDDDEFPWKKGPRSSLDSKYLYGTSFLIEMFFIKFTLVKTGVLLSY